MHFTSLHLLTAAAPSPPRNVQLMATSPDSIAVSWTMPSNNGGSAVVRYDVTLKRGAVTEQTMSPTSESTSFTELMEGVVYTVEVVAVNGVGSSSAATGTIDFSGMPQCKFNVMRMQILLTVWHFLSCCPCSSPSTSWCKHCSYLSLIYHCHMDPSCGVC